MKKLLFILFFVAAIGTIVFAGMSTGTKNIPEERIYEFNNGEWYTVNTSTGRQRWLIAERLTRDTTTYATTHYIVDDNSVIHLDVNPKIQNNSNTASQFILKLKAIGLAK